MMIRKPLQLLFPNALGVGPGWGMAVVWIILFFAGLMCIYSTLEQDANYMLPWQPRAFAGTVICYASVNGLANKAIQNNVV